MIKPIFGRRTGFLLLCALSLAVSVILACSKTAQNPVAIFSEQNGPAQFAVTRIQAALAKKGYPVQVHSLEDFDRASADSKIILFSSTNNQFKKAMSAAMTIVDAALQPEGFSLQIISSGSRSGGSIYLVEGYDNGGTMYGGLELAEQIAVYGLESVRPVAQYPYMEMRGTKFNIPLDARTPSYSDMSDAAQENMPEMWRFEFWQEYLDHLASHRYNFVSLWNLHPFPSMVKVRDYPDIALDDVKRSTTDWDEYYSTQAKGLDAPAILDNLETIVEISIDEKIAFWQKVMQYAADRNIKFYVITWNIFVYGTEGKYGITDDINNATTIDYFRKSVKQMFVTYPLLAGIGLTTGENMPGASFAEKEEWAFKTYGLGVLDAAEALPDRKITLIHRQHQAGAQAIARRFQSLLDKDNIDFIFSFKYAQAHVYSSTRQHFHHAFVNDIGDMKTIWTLRNDDVYQFRWGAPDFVREFIRNIPYEVGRGYYFGSDQYVWGREFLSVSPESPRELELHKHWYQWLLWGRLGYDPGLSNERLIAILKARFPETSAGKLFSAWQEASMIYPIVTGFHWGEFDFQWYIEACKSRPGPAQTASGFHDVNRFITLPPHKSTDYISIPDYVAALNEGRKPSGTTPVEVSEQISRHAEQALTLLAELDDHGNSDLQKTLHDIRTITLLGKYYAHKIRGATELALFRSSGKPANKEEALRQLQDAAEYWQQYTASAQLLYSNPFWTNRVGHVNWELLTKEVLNDIRIVESE